MRIQLDGRGFAQRLDFAPVRKRVAECDNVRGAAEMFDKTNDTAKGNLSEMIDRGFAVEELLMRNFLEVNLCQVLHLFHLHAHGYGRNLLVVANNDRLATKIESKHCRRVALACFVDDDYIEPCCARVKSL